MTYPPYPGTPGGPLPGDRPPADPLVPVDLSDWVAKLVGVVRRSWPRLAVIQLVAAAGAFLNVLASGGVSPRNATGGHVLLSVAWAVGVLALTLLAQGASVWVAVREAGGHPEPLGPALRFAASRALPLLGWSVVAGLMLVVGFLALVVPGLYLAVVFSASFAGVVMIERASIGRCFTLVNRRFAPTLGRCAIIAVAALVWSAVTQLLAVGPLLVHALIAGLLAVPSAVVGVAFAVVTYAELRWHEHPGTGTPALAAELAG